MKKSSEAYRGLTRLLLKDVDFSEGRVVEKKEIPEEALRHLKVLRIEKGEELEVLNGRGQRARVTFEKSAALKLRKIEEVPAQKPSLTLFLSPPRGDDFSQAISQATEMGVSKICFLRTQHNQFPKNAEPWPRALRLRDAALEQCGLAWAPEIGERWWSLEDALKTSAHSVYADESSAPGSTGVGWVGRVQSAAEFSLFVGPEGGWSSEELELLSKHAQALSLGPNILKVPTAIVVAITFLRSQAGK